MNTPKIPLEVTQLSVIWQALGERLPSEFSQKLLEGALRVAGSDNPIRGNLFAAAFRELISHSLRDLSPDKDIKACKWFKPETCDARPTRRQRMKYAVQGGISDSYLSETLGLEFNDWFKEIVVAYDELSKSTHLQPDTILSNEAEVMGLAIRSAEAMHRLLDAIGSTREGILKAVEEQLNKEAIDAILAETVLTIDNIAPHHSIDEIWADDIRVSKIDSEHVWYRVAGTIEAELQWGSSSDFRKGDGAAANHSFPFECDMRASVDSHTELLLDEVDLRVGHGNWASDADEDFEEVTPKNN